MTPEDLGRAGLEALGKKWGWQPGDFRTGPRLGGPV
jgi:hypothetical protein